MAPGAVLLDVGGTLWPDAWSARPSDRTEQVRRIRALAPALDATEAAALLDELETDGARRIEHGGQRTDDAITAVVAARQLDVLLPDPVALRRAISLPFGRQHLPLPGAVDLVRSLRAHGCRLVVVSNTLFRDAESYRADFDDAGIGGELDAIVTSVDLGVRKPDPALFGAALAAVGVEAGDAVMVGNSEESDVLPARGLGLGTVRVAIEEPAPASSAADEVVTSLAAVLDAVVRAGHRR